VIPDLDALVEHVLFVSETLAPSKKPRRWSLEEEDFLRRSMAYLTEAEIAEALGRSPTAVKLHRIRLDLNATSKTGGWISAKRAAGLLGLKDARYVSTWVKRGLVLGHILGGSRRICMLHLVSLYRFVLDPLNWPWFDPQAVRDPHLRALLERRKQRWGDEWLTSGQAARLAGLKVKQIEHCVRTGRLPAVHVPNKAGRHNEQPHWAYYFVRKSQVLTLELLGPGEANRQCTPAALEWIRTAAGMGWPVTAIARSMKKHPQTVRSWIRKYGLSG
jgi:hypothetical protein